MSKPKFAIICAYHPNEPDLHETLKSAARSAGKGHTIYAVEDKDGTGPGRNRHRGIEAAAGADVIVIIDAHMRFKGMAIERMVKHVRANGGLLVPYCHNNEECSFTANSGHAYAGARMVWASRDDDIRQSCALVAKWSSDQKPGPRTAVMGACYVFRRDWYYTVGQPLSILDGWGCDEELLSIAAWMSGKQPELCAEHVAHRFRARPPWDVPPSAHQKVTDNRRRMIGAVVSNEADRRDLYAWQGNQDVPATAESERLRKALLALPRKWNDWKKVCQPAEVNGQPVSSQPQASAQSAPRRAWTPLPVVTMYGVRCPHCQHEHDPKKLEVTNTYAKFRRHICPNCKRPFVTKFQATPSPIDV